MNPIESAQKRFLPGFYQSRYGSRKSQALSLQEKCQKDPSSLSFQEVRIVMKVLQQFQILPKQLQLEKKQGEYKSRIIQSAIYSTIIAGMPFLAREFYLWRPMSKILFVGLTFIGANYYFMRKTYNSYISSCQQIAHQYLPLLKQESALPV